MMAFKCSRFHIALRIHRIPRCCLGLSQYPVILQMCGVNVGVTALEFMDATVRYVETCSARCLQWHIGLKTQCLL